MPRIALPCLMLWIAVLTAAGCGKGNAEASEEENLSRLPTLSLLTWRYLPQDEELMAEFGREHAVNVVATVKPPGEILDAARNNRLAGTDLILLPSLEYATLLRDAGALQPFFVNAFTNGDVDDRYLDNEGYYAGLMRWTMALVYNPNAVTQEEATTYLNLAKLPLRGIRLGLAHPDSSGLVATIGGLAAAVNPRAADAWARTLILKSEGGPRGSDYDQLDRMLAGELDAALVSSGAAVRWMLNGNPRHFAAADAWRIRFPKTDNGSINLMNMSCVTLAKDAPRRKKALDLIDYLYRQSVQEALGNSWFEFPGQTFAAQNDYLIGLPDQVGREVSAEQLDAQLPEARAIVNRILSPSGAANQ